MEVVHYIQPTVVQVLLVDARHRIGSEHRNASLGEDVGQVVVDQAVVLVRARGEDDRIAVLGLNLPKYLGAAFLERFAKGSLRGIGLAQGCPALVRGYPVFLFHEQ